MNIMEKIWEIKTKFENDFKENNPEFSDLALQMLWNRNLTEKDEIKFFLEADFNDTHDPFLFCDMEKAIDLIIKHIKAQNKIYIYGDYDADGVTASAVVFEALTTLKAEADVYIPHRVSEGYGLNKEAIDFIGKEGAKLIITVDGGIRSKEEITYAQSLGVEVIVTDHHTPPNDKKDYPDSLIINPTLPEEKYPDKKLAGVGVAFKLAQALIMKSKLPESDKDKLIRSFLDLVAIGTVADCVKLKGENRIFVKAGLEKLQRTKRLGLCELMKIAKISLDKNLESWNIGFQIGPRLNAAGRMDHANTAYMLLVSKERREAVKIAGELNQRNIDRQKITEEIFNQVEKQINAAEDKIMIGVFESKEEGEDVWNEGVVGLVSGKITSKYYRPSMVITKTAEGYKGSGRGIPEFNIIEAVEKCGELLDKYGGHPAACGFSLNRENLPEFLSKIRGIADEKLSDADLKPKISIETELKMPDIDEKTLEIVNRFAPFGQDNDRPVFLSLNAKVVDIMYMGALGSHLKLRLKQDDSRVFSAIGFGQTEKWPNVKIGDDIDIVYSLDMNEYNGRREVQFKIIDIKEANALSS
jgi:single-stranded-DNA-specific exonuclease